MTAQTEQVSPVQPSLEWLDVDQVEAHPANLRARIADLDELAASIASQGVLEPLIVCPHPDGQGRRKKPRFRLVAGHRRHAAARKAGLKTIPAIVRFDLEGDAAQIEAMLVENLQRADLNPVEEGAAYQALLEFPGYNVQRISKSTGRARSTVKGRLQLCDLPKKVRDGVADGQVTVHDGLALAEFADDHEAFARLERYIGTVHFEWAVRQERLQRENAKKQARVEADLRKQGVRVLTSEEVEHLEDDFDWVDVDELVEHLDEEPAKHTSCPGHAVYMNGVGTPVAICTDPDTHHPHAAAAVRDPDVESPKARQQRAEREEERRADDERRTALEAAAGARWAHLAGLVADADLDKTKWPAYVVAAARDVAADGIYPGNVDAVLTLAGLGVVDGEERIDTMRRAKARIRGMTPRAAVLVAHVVNNGRWEHGLLWASNWLSDTSAGWREWLVESGYRWSPVEQELLAEAALAAADSGDGDADDGGDES